MLLLDLCRGGSGDFRIYGRRCVEFRSEGGKLTREGVCPAPLLFERLLRLSSLHSFQAYDPRRIEFRPEGAKFARKGVCPVSFLIKRLPLLDLGRVSC